MQKDRQAVIRGALLGTFAGDALGALWEGSEPAEGRSAADRVSRSLESGPLHYTDDTQLALALAEHLCADPIVDPAGFAATILEHYEEDRGYARATRTLFDRWRAGVPIAEAATTIFPDGSMGNGAAMRVAPVGALWAHDPEQLVAVARRQAFVTHVHPIGVDGALAQARAVGMAADSGAFTVEGLRAIANAAETPQLRAGLVEATATVADWASGALGFADVAERLGAGYTAATSVPAALWAAAVADDLPAAIELAVGLGGDADTIAAMVGAIHGAAATDAAIPAEWLAAFEDGGRGVTYTRELAARLAHMAIPPPPTS